MKKPEPRSAPGPEPEAGLIGEADQSLLDLIDNLLSKGVMVNAELILGIADVDLIYLRLSAVFCAADKVLPARMPAPSLPARKGRKE